MPVLSFSAFYLCVARRPPSALIAHNLLLDSGFDHPVDVIGDTAENIVPILVTTAVLDMADETTEKAEILVAFRATKPIVGVPCIGVAVAMIVGKGPVFNIRALSFARASTALKMHKYGGVAFEDRIAA